MKTKVTILLSTLLIAFAACQQTDETEQLASSGKGYIRLRLSTDETLRTRAMQDVSDISSWYAAVSNGDGTLFDQQIGNALDTRLFEPGTYNITVRNYDNANAANTANNGWGDAYHMGEANNVEVSAGGTAFVHINCGQALNAKFRLDYSQFSGIINTLSIQTPKQLTFAYADGTLTREAYFPPQTTITYTINYTIGDDTKPTEPATITLGGAATVSILRIKSDIHGDIRVTMTYDSEYEGDANAEIDIDGTNGN